jgi:hypothetical protein
VFFSWSGIGTAVVLTAVNAALADPKPPERLASGKTTA